MSMSIFLGSIITQRIVENVYLYIYIFINYVFVFFLLTRSKNVTYGVSKDIQIKLYLFV